ncbi:MAG TPA: AAA family ATPase [Candidatus Nanoarchaeia archaeon]|nr:ATP-binding protein [Candidatus Woesearchaeota archaeon]HLD37259.1 AAA family ATPase [Candidatus Nanoarchaeia archaeon]
MSFYIIIRGPLGCGKSTIAKALSKRLNAKYFAIDKILEDHNLEEWKEGYISEESFSKANEIAAKKARRYLEKGLSAVFDGNFYYKNQIEDLIKRLDFPHYAFTLKAPLNVCIERDSKRKEPHGKDAAEAVYRKSAEFDYGIVINTSKSLNECIKEIINCLPKQ